TPSVWPTVSAHRNLEIRKRSVMRAHRVSACVAATALAGILGLALAVPAHAERHGHHRRFVNGPWVGYAVPLQNVYQFSAALVHQLATPPGYAWPLQNVYQFPAALVHQPQMAPPFPMPGQFAAPTIVSPPGY